MARQLARVASVKRKAGAEYAMHGSRRTLICCLREQARKRPNKIAFMCPVDDQSRQTTLTYAQLDLRARAIAACLQKRHLEGRCVVLAFPPGLESIAAFFGVLYAGCIAVPTKEPRLRTLHRFSTIVADARAPFALSTSAAIAKFLSRAGRSTSVPWLATDEFEDSEADHWTEFDCPPDSLAMIQYTSGSTSRPNGVMLSHANLVENTHAISQAFELRDDSVAAFWLPIYHDMGLVGGVLAPVFCGTTNVIMAPSRFLQNPFAWLEAISKSRATIAGGPNFSYDLCVRKISGEQRAALDLSSWSRAFIGADAVQPATLARFAETFAPCGFSARAFFPCYGLAEATLMVTGSATGTGATAHAFNEVALSENRVERVSERAPGARCLVGCGAPVGSLHVAIVDAKTLEPAPSDRVGEIWVAGESVGQGYWGDPARTVDRFQARLRGGGDTRFLRTGDLGFFFDDQLYITGRLDDLIIVRGLNHNPQDIETTARESHALLGSGLGAAFAYDQDGAQRLVLVHEVECDGRDSLKPVFNAVRSAVLEVHGLALDTIVLIRCGTIARTSSGKVQRRAIRTAFLADQIKPLAQDASPPTPTPSRPPANPDALAIVYKAARAMSRSDLADATPETQIAALGLDSLQRAELVAALDSGFGRHLPNDVYTQATTLGDLAAAVEKHLIAKEHDSPSVGEIPAEHYDVALFPEYSELKRHERALLAVAGSNPYFRIDQGHDSQGRDIGGLAHIDGRELTNFCAYDYLGMARSPSVIAAAKAAIDRYGTGAGASRLVSGEKEIHRELETALAAFLGTPASIVLVSGHATNVTTIGHLLGPADLIVHDALAHNSILQGARLAGATCRGFPHNDWRALDTLLSAVRRGFRRVLIAVEGVYSMDGDFPDLARFVDIKNKHRAMLLVDEAHSLGTMGTSGRGVGEHANIERGDVELWMGTLSKTLASCGGYIAGSTSLIEYLKYTAPGFVYSVGISPPNAASALAALTLLRREPQRVARLQELSLLFLTLARDHGLNTGSADGTPIIPVIVDSSAKCVLLSRALFERGINVQPILHPANPERANRLRFFMTTHHTESCIRGAVRAIVEELTRLKCDE